MQVPTFRTWVAGEIATASYFNSNVRDAGNFLIARPLAVLRQATVQSTPSSSWTAMLLDTEDIDRDNAHSTSTNTSRYTSQTSGYYLLIGTGTHVSNATGYRGVALTLNGSLSNLYARNQVNAVNGSLTAVTTSAVLYLSAGSTPDYAELQTLQTSSAALNTSIVGLESPRLQVLWVST